MQNHYRDVTVLGSKTPTPINCQVIGIPFLSVPSIFKLSQSTISTFKNSIKYLLLLLYRCTYRGQCHPQAPTSPAKMILEYLYDQCAHFLIQTMTGLKKGNVEVGKKDHYTNGPHSTTLMLSLFPLAINLKMSLILSLITYTHMQWQK